MAAAGEQRLSGSGSMIESLGASAITGAYGQPSWFDPQAFLQPDFDAQAYVADLRKYVSFSQSTLWDGAWRGEVMRFSTGRCCKLQLQPMATAVTTHRCRWRSPRRSSRRTSPRSRTR